MKANWLYISAAIALALSYVTTSTLEFHGYARITKGSDVYCAGNVKRGHKMMIVLVTNVIPMQNLL